MEFPTNCVAKYPIECGREGKRSMDKLQDNLSRVSLYRKSRANFDLTNRKPVLLCVYVHVFVQSEATSIRMFMHV
jgi:hypothetical protein